MPYKIVRKSGPKPYKIVKRYGGKGETVGSSTSMKKAKASIRARYLTKK
jgi:hypothetical protein